MYRFVLLAFVATVSANIMADYQCPYISTVYNFDFKAYAKGTWYEIARYPNSAEKNAQCGSAEYTLDGNVARVKNIHVVNNKLKVIEGTHRLASNAGRFGKITVSLPYGAGGAMAENDLNILVFNNEFFIGYYCKPNPPKNIHQDFAWILSRTPTPSAETKAAIDKFLKESRILDSSKFIWPSFSEEDCRIDSY